MPQVASKGRFAEQRARTLEWLSTVESDAEADSPTANAGVLASADSSSRTSAEAFRPSVGAGNGWAAAASSGTAAAGEAPVDRRRASGGNLLDSRDEARAFKKRLRLTREKLERARSGASAQRWVEPQSHRGKRGSSQPYTVDLSKVGSLSFASPLLGFVWKIAGAFAGSGVAGQGKKAQVCLGVLSAQGKRV